MGFARLLRDALLSIGLAIGVVAAAAGAAERNLVVVATKAQPAIEPRVALVIGNADYPGAMLANPVNDARAIADRLTALRFRVTRLENASQDQMYEAIRSFGDQLRGGGVGLFYFAGHALQVRGRNYLLPVRARIEREDEIIYRTVDTGQILDKMESARNRVNIVILDACRNNPFGRDFRSVAPGLAVVDAPYNTLIAFATAPGAVASDGGGSNGLYTQHLLQAMAEAGVGLEDLFKKVRSGVRRDSAGRQVPWESTSLEVDFFFDLPPQQAAPALAPVPDALTVEITFWDSVKGSTDPYDYRAYLKRYPSGQFAVLADNRLRALAVPVPTPSPVAALAVTATPVPTPAAARPTPAPPPAPIAVAPPTVAPVVIAPVPVPTPAPAPPPPPTPTPQVVAIAPLAAPAQPAPLPVAPAPSGSPARSAGVPARAMLGHTGEVLAMAVSRNGNLALTGAADRSLRLWDLAAGRELRRFGTAAAAVTATAISADGRQFLSGSADRSVRLWDAVSGTEIVRLEGHASPVSAVLFGPTARYAVSAAGDGEVIVWDLPSGRVIRRAKASPGGVRSMALSADGRYLLTAADDALVRLWDVGSLAALRSFGPMSAPAAAVAFANAARSVNAVDARGELWTWQASSGALERRFATGGQPTQAVIDADGTTALLATGGGELVLWDSVSGRALWRGGASERRITALGLGARATIGLAAGDDKRLLLWALER